MRGCTETLNNRETPTSKFKSRQTVVSNEKAVINASRAPTNTTLTSLASLIQTWNI